MTHRGQKSYDPTGSQKSYDISSEGSQGQMILQKSEVIQLKNFSGGRRRHRDQFDLGMFIITIGRPGGLRRSPGHRRSPVVRHALVVLRGRRYQQRSHSLRESTRFFLILFNQRIFPATFGGRSMLFVVENASTSTVGQRSRGQWRPAQRHRRTGYSETVTLESHAYAFERKTATFETSIDPVHIGHLREPSRRSVEAFDRHQYQFRVVQSIGE